jgi:hypothetical protein
MTEKTTTRIEKKIEETIPFVLPWWTRAWNWFRKWGWVPLGLLFLLIVFILGGAVIRRREDGRVLTPLDDIKDALERHDAEVAIEVEKERQRHVAEVVRIEREHQAQIDKLTEDQERRRQELRQNPKKLARWLTALARGEE